MSSRTMLLPLALATATMFVPGVALACRCGEFTPAGAYRQADAVVVGRVVGVEGDFLVKGGGVAILSVGKAWKKRVPRRLRVSSRTTCAVAFKRGESYVIYLKAATGRAAFSTTRCAGTRPLTEAGTVMQWLRRNGAGAEVAE
jgi:hypothetical protein